MPAWESVPIAVVMTIEVDGHVLAFAASGEATGGRYHGVEPMGPYRSDESLEAHIRDVAEAHIRDVAEKAERFLRRAYPVAGDAVASALPPD